MKKEKGKTLVIGAVKGLVSESEKVQEHFSRFDPEVIALSVSKEGLQAMAEYLRSDNEDDAGSDNVEEEYYVQALKKFGDVSKPPPCFVKAWELGLEKDIPTMAVDLDDEEFTDIYCHHVTGVEWLKQPSKQRSLARKKFKSKTAEEFVIEWDQFINDSKAMRSIESSRVSKITREVNELSKKYDRIMLVVDYERADEVKQSLLSSGCGLVND